MEKTLKDVKKDTKDKYSRPVDKLWTTGTGGKVQDRRKEQQKRLDEIMSGKR